MTPPGRVVVITGASSGIGRASAHAFARTGARLVLAARSATSLEAVKSECEALGGAAIVVPTDVRSDEQVEALAAAAIAAYGRIDVWVGAAAVFAYGRFEDVPAEVFRELLDVNLFGQARGLRAVLPHLRRQRSGVVILFGSVYSRMATPYASAYITSKHAVLGLSDSVRQEVREHGIRVCAVLPVTADTPIYQHAANFMGKPMHPLPPAIDPERVARAVVRIANRPRPSTVVGTLQRFAIPAQRWAPSIAARLSLWVMNRMAVQRGTASNTTGTVYDPHPASNSVSGGWRKRR